MKATDIGLFIDGLLGIAINFTVTLSVFHVLLTVHPGMILVNNQLDAQFFTYVHFYSLHVSGSCVPSIGRIIVISAKSGLCHSV